MQGPMALNFGRALATGSREGHWQARPGQATGSHIWGMSLMRMRPCWRVGRHWHVPSMFPASTRFATSESRERGGHAMDWRCAAPTSAAACSSLQPSLSPSPSPTCAAFFYNLDLSDGSAGATDRRGRAARERECLIGRRRGNRRSTRRQVPLASSNEQFYQANGMHAHRHCQLPKVHHRLCRSYLRALYRAAA